MENLAPEFIVLTSKTKSHLFSIAKWARIIALIGFIILFFGFFVLVYSLGFSGFSNNINASKLLLFIPSLIFTFIYLYAIYKLYNFSKYCKKALKEYDGVLLELSLNNLRQNFKIVGLITLIVSLIYLVLFIAIAVGGSLAYKFY
ncbi:MAG: hypothetical protein ACOYMA_12370 [Bacteroidia bacterium]